MSPPIIFISNLFLYIYSTHQFFLSFYPSPQHPPLPRPGLHPHFHFFHYLQISSFGCFPTPTSKKVTSSLSELGLNCFLYSWNLSISYFWRIFYSTIFLAFLYASRRSSSFAQSHGFWFQNCKFIYILEI